MTLDDEIWSGDLPRSTILSTIAGQAKVEALHRDYTSPTDIQIKIFDNAITFFNPGRLYGDPR